MLDVVLKALEVVLYMVVNGVRCVLWVLRAMVCTLFCMLLCLQLRILEAVESELRLLDMPE